jgi:hypothetical protein
LYQGSNEKYLESQLLLLNEMNSGLSQLTTEPSLAKVLNASSFKPVKPLDALTNSLVSPLFYGIQSSATSNEQGRVTISGVHVTNNLPGKWTLQCGVDGVMMETPVGNCFILLFPEPRHLHARFARSF